MDLERRDIRLVETKASDETPGVFSGYGAVFGNVDGQGDVIKAGAFAQSLGEWKSRGKFPPMLLQHGGGMFGGSADSMLPVGQWTEMRENSRGLQVEGRLFALNTERGQYIYEGLKSGALDGLSIGYRTREAIEGTRAGEPDRTLTNLDLWEVSIVTFPANPKARITTVKSLTVDNLRLIEDFLYEDLKGVGFSHLDAKRVVASIRKYLHRDGGGPDREQRDAAADGEVDQLLEAVRSRTESRLAGALRAHLSITAGGSRR